MPDHGKTLVEWRVDEYPRYERSAMWYLGAFVVGGGLVVYALVTLNFLFALILIMFGIIIALSATREPHRIRFAVTEDGLEVGHRFIPWKDVERFWIMYEPPEVKNLYIDFRSVLRPHLSIPLEQTDPNAVRRALLPYAQEDLTKEDEPLSDFLSRVLKF